jgi:hypothetical protein
MEACVCVYRSPIEDHETVDHIIWKFFRFSSQKTKPDSEVITVWRLRGDPDTRLVCTVKKNRVNFVL